MRWFNLKNNKCPKCNKDLEFQKGSDLIFCSSSSCEFQISKEKLSRIVSDMIGNEIDKEHKELKLT